MLKDTDPSLQSSCNTIVIADLGCIVVNMLESQVFLINLSIAFSAHPSNTEKIISYITFVCSIENQEMFLPGMPVFGRNTTSTVALLTISLFNLTSTGP